MKPEHLIAQIILRDSFLRKRYGVGLEDAAGEIARVIVNELGIKRAAFSQKFPTREADDPDYQRHLETVSRRCLAELVVKESVGSVRVSKGRRDNMNLTGEIIVEALIITRDPSLEW